MSSTLFAIRIGLQEANTALLGVSSFLGLGFVDSFLILKVSVTLGAGTLLFIGVKNENRKTAQMAFIALICFAALYAFASANNLFAIAYAS